MEYEAYEEEQARLHERYDLTHVLPSVGDCESFFVIESTEFMRFHAFKSQLSVVSQVLGDVISMLETRKLEISLSQLGIPLDPASLDFIWNKWYMENVARIVEQLFYTGVLACRIYRTDVTKKGMEDVAVDTPLAACSLCAMQWGTFHLLVKWFKDRQPEYRIVVQEAPRKRTAADVSHPFFFSGGRPGGRPVLRVLPDSEAVVRVTRHPFLNAQRSGLVLDTPVTLIEQHLSDFYFMMRCAREAYAQNARPVIPVRISPEAASEFFNKMMSVYNTGRRDNHMPTPRIQKEAMMERLGASSGAHDSSSVFSDLITDMSRATATFSMAANTMMAQAGIDPDDPRMAWMEEWDSRMWHVPAGMEIVTGVPRAAAPEGVDEMRRVLDRIQVQMLSRYGHGFLNTADSRGGGGGQSNVRMAVANDIEQHSLSLEQALNIIRSILTEGWSKSFRDMYMSQFCVMYLQEKVVGYARDVVASSSQPLMDFKRRVTKTEREILRRNKRSIKETNLELFRTMQAAKMEQDAEEVSDEEDVSELFEAIPVNAHHARKFERDQAERHSYFVDGDSVVPNFAESDFQTLDAMCSVNIKITGTRATFPTIMELYKEDMMQPRSIPELMSNATGIDRQHLKQPSDPPPAAAGRGATAPHTAVAQADANAAKQEPEKMRSSTPRRKKRKAKKRREPESASSSSESSSSEEEEAPRRKRRKKRSRGKEDDK